MAAAAPKTGSILLRNLDSVLITGGARSGKSRLAETLSAPFNRVTLVATAQALDEEMAARIARHRERRPSHWTTVEEPVGLLDALRAAAAGSDLILVDCLTLWLSNLMARDPSDAAILQQVEQLAEFCSTPSCVILLVTNEVGLGVVPDNPSARRFRDLAGTANQRLAQACRRVIWSISGIPVEIK